MFKFYILSTVFLIVSLFYSFLDLFINVQDAAPIFKILPFGNKHKN